MKNNIKFFSIIKNIFLNKVYLGILLGSIVSMLLLSLLYFKYIAPSFYTQMMSNVTDEAKRIGTHIKWHQTENIDFRKLEKLRRDFDLYKIRLFDENGFIVLSTVDTEIGKETTYKYFKTILPKGDIYYKVGRKIQNNKEIDVAEIYVPIMLGNKFKGASEIYFNITEQKNDFQNLLDKTTNILILAFVVFISILFIVLFFSSKNNLLQKNKELMLFEQSKLASMGEMIGNIAHQWRQPLSMISTSITALKAKNEMGIMDKKDLDDTVKHVVNSVNYLSTTIDDFRNFFDKDKNITNVNIKDLINSTHTIVNDNLVSNNIILYKDLNDIQVEVLENELKQVLINIINNAKDALLSDKNSELDKKIIIIDTKQKDNKLVINIQDNAGGIPDNIFNKIFEPYFTTKHKSIGTGIGLYMCKTIIETNMKGSISVVNQEFVKEGKTYKGAKFSIQVSI